jgi:hypothetical protein
MADLVVKLGADVTDLNKGIKSAEASLTGFNNTVKRSVPGTAQAFTNLNRVVQDAPFGFIAIQNNIDPLIQSFQQLKLQTGSTGGAIKALAAGLIGSGGVLFAFSAITSIITTAIQKYGSLGAAITEFSAATDAASVRTRALNKALVEGISSQQGEILTIKNLVSILNSSQSSQEERIGAYSRLKKEFPGVLDNLSKENALTTAGGQIIAARAKQLVDYILLKGKEAALIKLVEEASKKELEAAKQSIDILGNQSTVLSRLTNIVVGLGNENLGLTKRLLSTGKSFDKAGTDASEYGKLLNAVQKQITAFDPTIITPTTSKPVTVKVPKVTYVPQAIEVQTISSSVLSDAALARDFRIDSGIEVPLNLTIPQAAFDALRKFGEDANWKLIQEKSQSIINQFDQFLTPVINTAFQALGNGADIFKSISQSLKALVVQIGIAIARAAILSAILSSTGIGAAVGAGGSTVRGFGAIFRGLLGVSGAAGPNFGGVSGGGLALSGGVTIQARGTDLVGVLSGSNARIGRVG